MLIHSGERERAAASRPLLRLDSKEEQLPRAEGLFPTKLVGSAAAGEAPQVGRDEGTRGEAPLAGRHAALLEGSAEPWCQGSLNSCRGRRRLSRRGARRCPGRSSAAWQPLREGSLNPLPQRVPRSCCGRNWRNGILKNMLPLGRCHKTQLRAAYPDICESSLPKVQIRARESCAASFSAGCYFFPSLFTHRSLRPPS